MDQPGQDTPSHAEAGDAAPRQASEQEPPAPGSAQTPRRPLLADPLPLLGFFTRIPVGTGVPVERVAAAFPLVPMVGWVTGAVTAAVALALAPRLPEPALAAVLLTIMVGLTGLNQMDGLLDLGDGLMVHGDAERRLQVMHDHSAGVGAVGLVLFTYLVAFAALAGLAGQLAARGWVYLAIAVLAAEILSRLPFVVLAWAGEPSHGGLGALFMDGFGLRHLVVGVVAAAPAVAAGVWLGWLPLLLAVVASLLVALGLLETASRLFGGIGGDVFGASQEVARAAVLLAMTFGLGWSGG